MENEDLSEDVLRNIRQQSFPGSDTSPEAFSPDTFDSSEQPYQREIPQTKFGRPSPVITEDELMLVEDPMTLSNHPTTTWTSADRFYSLEFNQMLPRPPITSPRTPYISLDLEKHSDPFYTFSPEETQLSFLPRSPNSTRHYLVQYYLTYHREAINEYQYYSYYDYGRLFTKGLSAMAESSDALLFAQAAFAALLFSQRLNPQIKPVSFALYSLALLNRPSLSDSEGQIAMAAAMQLSTYDVLPTHLPSSYVAFLRSPPLCRLKYCMPLLIVAFFGRQLEVFPPHGRRRPNHAPLLEPHQTIFHPTRSLPLRMVLRFRRPLLCSCRL